MGLCVCGPPLLSCPLAPPTFPLHRIALNKSARVRKSRPKTPKTLRFTPLVPYPVTCARRRLPLHHRQPHTNARCRTTRSLRTDPFHRVPGSHLFTFTSNTGITHEETSDCRALRGSPLPYGISRCPLAPSLLPDRSSCSLRNPRGYRICLHRCTGRRCEHPVRGPHLRTRPGSRAGRTQQPRYGRRRARTPGHRQRPHRCDLSPRLRSHPERTLCR